MGQWTGNPSMKLRATGTNCSNTIQASNVGDTGPEKENRKERYTLKQSFKI